MKNVKWSLIMILMLNLSLFCNDSRAAVQINAKEISSATVNVQAKLPQLTGMPDSLIQDIINYHLEKNFYNSAIEYLDAMQNEREEVLKKKTQLPATAQYSFNADYTVHFNSEKILSITQLNYSYTGGAHGMNIMHGTTVNLLTGKVYKLPDLFLPDKEYKKVINEIITQQIQSRADAIDLNFKGISNEQKFYLENDNLVIYFSVYEIGPYVLGHPSFKIPFSSLMAYLDMTKIK